MPLFTDAPFDSLPLKADEVVTYTGINGTFHRGFDPAFAASNQAAYLHVWRPFRRGKWLRFPYTEISVVEVRPRQPPHLPFIAAVVLSVSVAVALATTVASPLTGLLLVALVSYFGMLGWRSLRGRHALVLSSRSRRQCFLSPSDTYADDKQRDGQLLVEFATALGHHGVQVFNAAATGDA